MKSHASTPKLLRILTLMTALSALAACSALTPSARAPIELPAIPQELVACGYGVPIPAPAAGKKISQLQTETYWLQDRKTLRDCRTNHEATIRFYNNLRTNLRSPAK